MKPRYSIIPGDFAEDGRADVAHFRVLNLIGRHTDEAGWCRLKQQRIAEAAGLTRETVNRKIKDLVEWGYVEKHAEDATGRAMWYRTIMDRPGKPRSEATVEADPGVDFARETSDGPVSGGSHVGYNPDAELHPTCEEQITPGVSAGNHTRCDRIGSQQERPSLTTKKDSPPPPQGAEREGEVQLLIREGAGDAASHVTACLKRILEAMRVEHPSPKTLVAEVARALAAHPENVLEGTASELIRTRKKIVSVKCVTDALAAAEAKLPLIHVKPGDPSFAAWCAAKADQPFLVKYARQEGFRVRSVWPVLLAPGDCPPGSRPPGAGAPSGRLAERESDGASDGAEVGVRS